MRRIPVLGWALRRLLFVITALLVPVFGAVILLSVLVPGRIREIRVAGWATTITCRIGLWLLGVKVHSSEREAIANHDGFLFPNHWSFIDILVMLSFAPVRFLAATHVRTMPVVGAVATAIGTQFVDRSSPESRAKSRNALMDSPARPPIVIFPEGGIPSDPVIWPLHYGAFEIAAHTGRSAQIVGIVYDNPGARWANESMVRSWFRVQTGRQRTGVAVSLGPSFSAHEVMTNGVAAAAEQGRDYFHQITGLPLGDRLSQPLP